jgi:flavin-dependent dehydrogenase
MPRGRVEYDADIVIAGAGPAGSAAALAARGLAPGLTTILIEADAPTVRIGEVLPAAGFAMLRQLGVAGAVTAACRPSRGIVSLWGEADVRDRPSLFSARGPDQHLDRARFDRLLADAAESAGAVLRRGITVTGAEPVGDPGEGWRLRLGGAETMTARLAIWATGRKRGFLHQVGAHARVYDRLAGFIRYVAAGLCADQRTLLEAAPDGWWYAASLPSGEHAIAFMTDADIGRPLHLTCPRCWQAQLARTQLIGRGHEDASPDRRIQVRAAHSSLIEPISGLDWIAAGDAASCFEPLASQGIARALRSGCFAAYAGVDILIGRSDVACARYGTMMRREFTNYRQTLSGHYADETRWRTHEFWARRHRAGGDVRSG